MKYPNHLQAALLLDHRFGGLDEAACDFVRLAEMKSGVRLATVDHRPGSFLRLSDPLAGLMVTLDCIATPPDPAVFASALASPVTTLITPDMRARVARARGHVLVEIGHGPLVGAASHSGFDAVLEEVNPAASSALPPESAAAFDLRLDLLALAARVVTDHAQPGAIHWTQSNQLFAPDTFEAVAAMGFPGPLAIHPMLFGTLDAASESAEIGLRTFGARHFLGREIIVPATRLPWSAAYEAALAFCAFAAMEDGFVIPDGDTFGPPASAAGEPEAGIGTWRVHHREAPQGPAANDDADARSASVALYELVPLRHDGCGFVGVENPEAAVPLPTLPAITEIPDPAPDPDPDGEASHLAELTAALAAGRAEAAANPPPELPDPRSLAAMAGTPSRPGELNVSGRSLRARVFGAKEA